MPERVLAVFPGVALSHLAGVQVFTLLLTDWRSVLVLEGGDRFLVERILGDVPAGPVPPGRGEGVDVETLAEGGRNRVVPHHRLTKVGVRQREYDLSLTLAFRDVDGRKRTLRAQVVPPRAFAERQRAAGRKGRAFAAYGRALQEAYDRAVPRTGGATRNWRP